MANISQLQKVSHVVTAGEESGFVVHVPVLWASPMSDTNYVVHLTLETPRTSSAAVTVMNLTPEGFTARAQSAFVAGDVITFHAMAAHK